MSVTIKRTTGTTPPPFNSSLIRPFSGFIGALFRVSVFSGFFSVGS